MTAAGRRWSLVGALGLVLLGSCAPAAASVSDIFVLDYARSSSSNPDQPAKVIKVDPGTLAQTPLVLTAGAPPPSACPMPQPAVCLRDPVGLDVDENPGPLGGTLLVAVSGDYSLPTDCPGTNGCRYSFGDPPQYPSNCGGNGCGALVRIDPTTAGAATTTLISGPTTEGDNNLWENPYDVLSRPVENDILVLDASTTRVIRVNPANGNQSIFSRKDDGTLNGDGGPGGLRIPWGIARDPTNGDIIVVSNGTGPLVAGCDLSNHYCRFNPSEWENLPGFPPGIPGGDNIPPECLDKPPGHIDDPPVADDHNDGFVARFSSTGYQKALYCSDDFVRPRSVAVDSTGRIFVSDPMAIKQVPDYVNQDAVGYGVVFEIDPASGQVEPVSAGSNFATPSGLDFNPAGNRLLLADETLFQDPPVGPCTGGGAVITGCGGVIQVNPDGGQQTVVSSRTIPSATTNYLDPIELTVDRRTLAPPTLPINTVPLFLDDADTRPERAETTNGSEVTSVPLVPVRGGSTVSVTCLDADCAGLPAQTFSVPQGQPVFSVPIPSFTIETTELFCPAKRKLKGKWCYLKKKRKKLSASGAACVKGKKRCPASTRVVRRTKKPGVAKIATSNPQTPIGRYANIALGPTTATVQSQGCLNSQGQETGCPSG